MGWPMAANLLAAGYDLRAWNRSPEPGQRLAARGAQVASSPREAVRDADVVILILADDAATRSTLQAVDEALRPGAIVVNMATVSAELSAGLAADFAGRGIRYVAAPVLGRVDVAEAGELNILAAGEAAAIDAVQPLFDVMGRKTWRYGERPEQASVVKLAVNFMIASAIGAMGEAAALVRGHGAGARPRRGRRRLSRPGDQHRVRLAGVPGLRQRYCRRALHARRLPAGAGAEGRQSRHRGGGAGPRAPDARQHGTRCHYRRAGPRRRRSGLRGAGAHQRAPGGAGVTAVRQRTAQQAGNRNQRR